MSELLTGRTVSSTYLNLVQHVSDNYYDGAGNLLLILDGSTLELYIDGSLNDIRASYIPDASLSSDFYWNSSNLLEVSTGFGGVTFAYVDGSLNAKADLTYVDGSLNTKADLTYVDASLLSRDAYNVIQDTSITLKADLTYVDAYNNIQDTSILLKTNDASLDLYVVKSGDTMYGDLDMSTNAIINVESIHFSLDVSHLHQEGVIHWNDDDKTLELDTEVSGTTESRGVRTGPTRVAIGVLRCGYVPLHPCRMNQSLSCSSASRDFTGPASGYRSWLAGL